MRRGYWKTLLRNLRSRVAAGNDTFLLAGIPLKFCEIVATGEESLDGPAMLSLAVGAEGRQVFIDPATCRVLLQQGAGAPIVPLDIDLAAFIDALRFSSSPALALGAVVDEVELLRPGCRLL